MTARPVPHDYPALCPDCQIQTERLDPAGSRGGGRCPRCKRTWPRRRTDEIRMKPPKDAPSVQCSG